MTTTAKILTLLAAVFYGAGTGCCIMRAKSAEPPSDVIVTINGRDVTRYQVMRNVEMMVYLARSKNHKATDGQLNQFRMGLMKSMPEILALRALYETKLMATNIVCPAFCKRSVERRYLANYGAKNQTFKDLNLQMAKAGWGIEFWKNVEFDMKVETLMNTVFSNEVHVTEADIAKAHAKDEAYNAEANATNALSRSVAADIVKRARAGEDFAKLADRFSRELDDYPHGDMGDCDQNDFSEAPMVWTAVKKTPVGGVTDVLEGEDGFFVYKVVAKHSAKESTTETDALQLSRVYIPKAYVIEEKPEDEFREEVEESKRSKFVQDLQEKLRRESTIVRQKKEGK